MKKHTLNTYLFVWLINVIALTIFIYNINYFDYPSKVWLHCGIWSLIIIIARLGALFELPGSSVSYGWVTAVEFASLFILPFPLFVLVIYISGLLAMVKRVKQKHPTPFFGPDFNASNVIISGFVSLLVFNYITDLLAHLSFGPTVAIISATISYAVLQIGILNTLICIDEKIPWRKAPTLSSDSLISEAVFICAGALISKMYNMDPYLIIFILIPILYLHKVLERLKDAKLAYIDEKTGLPNYRYFNEKLTELYKNAQEKDEALSVIFIDMDYLREINNTYGHHVGDNAICLAGQIIQREAGDDAICARFGGEEFVVLLKKKDNKSAKTVAERIRKAIDEDKLVLENGDTVELSISLGIASYPETHNDLKELVKAADIALYNAKNSGRNSVKVYSSDMKDLNPITKMG